MVEEGKGFGRNIIYIVSLYNAFIIHLDQLNFTQLIL